MQNGIPGFIGAIASYNYGFTAANPITFGTSPTPSQEMQNLFYAFNGENDEGFNSQISILDAYKLHLLSKVETIYSRGYDIIRKPFKKSTTTNFTVNGRYIKELTIEPYYYEKPDLSVIENITKWEGKTKDELHTELNLMDGLFLNAYTSRSNRKNRCHFPSRHIIISIEIAIDKI